MLQDIFNGLGVEIELALSEDFLKVRETLTRIGVASKHGNTLYQSCHILHKRGRYAIIHFKELFLLDGRRADISEDDIGRRNTIARLLDEWRLVKIINPAACVSPSVSMQHVKVIQHADKLNWKLCAKYTIGRKKSNEGYSKSNFLIDMNQLK